jgi:hypothetical protein
MTNPWGSPQPFDPNQPGFPSGGPEQADPAGYGYPSPASYPGAGVPYPSSYPGGYPGYPPAGYPTPAPRDHPQAVTAMVLGILGLVCCGLASPFAIWTGRKSMKEIDASGGWLGGRGQAQAGFILGIIGTVLWVLGVLFYLVLIGFGLTAATQTTGIN